ncbi:MAG: hypothetical protein ACYC3I_09635 [Gemmataceae bacterium]
MEPHIFPHDRESRIPIFAVTGNRARDAGRCLAALLTDAGYRVGRASRDGIFLAGLKIHLEDATAGEKARAVLHNSFVEAAILEYDGRDTFGDGFGCDRIDVALLTGADSESSVEEWSAMLQVLEPDGRAVLNGDDSPLCSSDLPPADRLIWFARTGDNDYLSSHRAAGGTAVFLCADSLVVARGDEELRLPFGGRPVEREPREQLALLAALAGAMALNLCGDEKSRTPVQESAAVQTSLSIV